MVMVVLVTVVTMQHDGVWLIIGASRSVCLSHPVCK